MSESFLGYPGLENLLYVFAVQNASEGNRRFPNWRAVSFQCEEANPRTFFLNILNKAETDLGKDRGELLEQCEIAPGIAVFIEFSWRNSILTHCSAQAIAIPNGTLRELLSEQPPRAHYHRFDFSVEERGNLFDHPFPHIHSYFDGAPRFPFCFADTAFPLFRWLEFLMLNFHYPRWMNWAKDQCANSQTTGLRSASRTSSDYFDDYPDLTKWSSIPIDEREAFLNAAKMTLKAATNAATTGFPNIPEEFLKLNYWSS